MTLSFERLDSTFGLMPWGRWAERRPSGGRTVCTCGSVVALDPVWGQCSYCVRLEPMDDCAGNVCATINPDGSVTFGCEIDASVLGCGASLKMTKKTRRLVVAFYQAIVERLVVSRMTSYDSNDCMLAHYYGGVCVDFDRSPLKCLDELCGFNDDAGGYGWPLMGYGRKSAGAICGKISDGAYAHAAMKAVTAILKNPKTLSTYEDSVIFPPTPTRRVDGHLPAFGGSVFDTGAWFNRGDISCAVFRAAPCTCLAGKVEALERRVMPRLGAGDFKDSHTDSWLSDLTMRKPSTAIGIDYLDAQRVAPLFREILEAINASGFGLDAYEINGIIEAFISKSIRTDAGDASGDFAATGDDKCVTATFAERLGEHNCCGIVSSKPSSVALGHMATVLGSFGQNVVRYGLHDCGIQFKRQRVRGSRTVGYSATVGVIRCGGQVFDVCATGYNPCTEVMSAGFEVCGISKSANFQNVKSCSIGIGATVEGYGGALPWFGGDIILYPGPDSSCSWLCKECRCVPISELIGGCDYYWRLRHTLPRHSGGQEITFCFSWNCADYRCRYPLVCTCRECYYGVRYSTLYPSRSVLQTKLIEFLRDVNVYYLIEDSAYKLLSGGVEQRGFQHAHISNDEMRRIVTANSAERPTHYLSCSFLDVLRKADQYVKGDTRILSTGYSQIRHYRSRGDELPGVIHPTTFPITREMIFEGDKALIDSRDEDELTAEINKDCNVFTCGCWPVAVRFGAYCGQICAVAVRNLRTGRIYEISPQEVTFRCSSWGREYRGWRVGFKRFIGNFGVEYGKWEPYTLATHHNIRAGQAFGVVRWDYKVMKRV